MPGETRVRPHDRAGRSKSHVGAFTAAARRASVVALIAATVVTSAAAGNSSQRDETTANAVRLLAGPLQTGVVDPGNFSGPEARLAIARTAATGASTVRLILYWVNVAPTVRRPDFDPTNPADAAYRWEAFDREVTYAVAAGLSPIVSIMWAPTWAEGNGEGPPGTVRPDPTEFGHFARAAARRYSGRVAGLPRVRYWQAWNEPNLTSLLTPQFVGRRPVVTGVVPRDGQRVLADAVHSVHRDNIVVAGGLAPFTVATRGNPQVWYGATGVHASRCSAFRRS